MWKPSLRYAIIVFTLVYLNSVGSGFLDGTYFISWELSEASQSRLNEIWFPSCLCLLHSTAVEPRSVNRNPTPCKDIYCLAFRRNNYADSCVIFHFHEVYKHLASRLNLKSAPARPFQVCYLFFLWSQGRKKNTCGIWDQDNNCF